MKLSKTYSEFVMLLRFVVTSSLFSSVFCGVFFSVKVMFYLQIDLKKFTERMIVIGELKSQFQIRDTALLNHQCLTIIGSQQAIKRTIIE